YTVALALDPRHVSAHRAFGMMLLAGGKAADALVHLEQAAALEPRSYAAWVDVATAHLKLQQLDAAQAALERAVVCDARGLDARQLAFGHSVWQTAIGFIEGLDPGRFAVTVIRPANAAPYAPSCPDRAVPVVTVPETLEGARAAIAELGLDVLVHGEIGMDILG